MFMNECSVVKEMDSGRDRGRSKDIYILILFLLVFCIFHLSIHALLAM